MKERIHYFDNLKFVLIFLVVLAHFIAPLKDITFIKYIYWFIYIFHMPCFVFILGFFMKNTVKDGKIVNNKWLNYLLLYCIMQLLLIVINDSSYTFFTPKHGLWYLQCLIIWTLLLPVLTRINPKLCIIFTFLASLIIGFDDSAGSVASLSRAVTFLPFFMLGFYATKENIAKIKENKKIIVITTIFSLLILLALLQLGELNNFSKVFYGKSSYDNSNLGNIGVLYRSLWYLLAISFSALLMAFVPKNKNLFTNFGGRTLQVYCLHILLFAIYKKFEVFEVFNSNIGAIILMVLSFGLTVLLSTKIFSIPFNWIMNLKFKRILNE